ALAVRALLQKQFARGIEHEQRERAVQCAGAEVRIGLRQEADLAVIAVHQNQLLVIAGYDSVIEFRVFQAAHQPRVADQRPSSVGRASAESTASAQNTAAR